jgi:hypothetical protein
VPNSVRHQRYQQPGSACYYNPYGLPHRSKGTLKAVEHMAAAGETTMIVKKFSRPLS